MFSGGIRRGLHIDDDDEAKPTYEYQGTYQLMQDCRPSANAAISKRI
jgi:hypothetical protein